MSASPSEAGRHRAVSGREGDLVDSPSLTERRRASGRHDVVAIAVTALMPIVVAVALVVHNYAYWGQPSSTVVITSTMPDGTISQVKKKCDAVRFTVKLAPSGRIGSFRDCRTAYSIGQHLGVVWSPTDPEEVDPHVTEPLGVVTDTGVVALIPLGLAGLAFLRRRRSKNSSLPGR